MPLLRCSAPIPPKDRPLVRDLSRHQFLGEPQTSGFIEAQAILRRPHLDIAVTDAVGDAAEPTAVTMEGHRNFAFEQRGQRRRGDRHIAEQRDVRNIDEADLRFAALFVGDLERLSFLADPSVLGLDNERQRLVRRNGDCPRRER